MRLAIPVIQKISDFGAMNFQGEIQRHVKEIFNGANMDGVNPATLYQDYAYAYTLAAAKGNYDLFLSNALNDVDITDESGHTSSIIESVPVFDKLNGNAVVGFELQYDMEAIQPTMAPTFLNVALSENEYALALTRSHSLFEKEFLSQTGLLGIVKSMVPGQFIDYLGDDINSLVIETEAVFSL